MKFKNKRDAINKISQEGFFVDNNVYQGVEDFHKMKTQFVIDGKLKEVKAFSEGYMSIQRGMVFFDSEQTTMSKDSYNGLLYQQKETRKINILIPETDSTIEGMDIKLQEGKMYSIDKKGNVKEVTLKDVEKLNWYDDLTPDSKIKADKLKTSIEYINNHRKVEEEYKNELTEKSSLRSSVSSIRKPRR